jgi:hypothetical protein
MFEDFFVEQLVKQGLVSRILPSPGPNFFILLPFYVATALVIYIFVWKRLVTKTK